MEEREGGRRRGSACVKGEDAPASGRTAGRGQADRVRRARRARRTGSGPLTTMGRRRRRAPGARTRRMAQGSLAASAPHPHVQALTQDRPLPPCVLRQTRQLLGMRWVGPRVARCALGVGEGHLRRRGRGRRRGTATRAPRASHRTPARHPPRFSRLYTAHQRPPPRSPRYTPPRPPDDGAARVTSQAGHA